MKRIIFSILILNSFLFASAVTKEDLVLMQNNIIKVMEANNKNLETKIDAVETKVEATNQRIDSLKTNLETKIDSTNKRIDSLKANLETKIDATNQRIDLLKTSLETQIKATNDNLETQIKSVDIKVENTNQRIDDLYNVLVVLMGGIFALIGFIMWDRRTMIEKTKSEIANHTKEYYTEKNTTKEILEILREYAKKDKDLENILSKHNLSIS